MKVFFLSSLQIIDSLVATGPRPAFQRNNPPVGSHWATLLDDSSQSLPRPGGPGQRRTSRRDAGGYDGQRHGMEVVVRAKAKRVAVCTCIYRTASPCALFTVSRDHGRGPRPARTRADSRPSRRPGCRRAQGWSHGSEGVVTACMSPQRIASWLPCAAVAREEKREQRGQSTHR